MSNNFDPDQARPGLAPNCLQKLAADDITLVDKELKKETRVTNSERTNRRFLNHTATETPVL